MDETRHQRAKFNTRAAPQSYWYGLMAFNFVLMATTAVAAAATPEHVEFGERLRDGLLAGLISFLLGALLLISLTYLWFWWRAPMAMLEDTRSAVLSMVADFLEVRNLNSLLDALKQCHADTMTILGQLGMYGQHIDQQTFEAWNSRVEAVMKESGDDYYARYAMRVAQISLPPAPGQAVDMRVIYSGVMEVITDAIEGIVAKREQAQMRGLDAAPVDAPSRARNHQ